MHKQTLASRVMLRRTPRIQGMGLFLLLLLVFSILTTLATNLLPQSNPLSSSAKVQAATSSNLNYQARLLSSNGNIVPDGYYNIQFKLYNAASGGTALWTETYYDSNGVTAGNDNRVRVVNGYLSVNLASQTAFPAINWDQDMWLTMNIGGSDQTATPTYDGEMTPRIKLTAVPYAFQAESAKGLSTLQGANSGTLDFTTLTASRSILLPNASGTVCLQSSTSCGFALSSGSGDYIQNGTTPQTASFNVNGTGVVGGNFTNNGYALFQNGANSTTAFQIQNSAGTSNLFVADTTNNRIGIGTATPGAKLSIQDSNALKLEFKDGAGSVVGQLRTDNINNIGLGSNALASNTVTGTGNAGLYNSAFGTNALRYNTTGFNNTASGYQALFNNTTGFNNTATGSYALQSNTTGTQNTASGLASLSSNTTGYENAATGVNGLGSNTTGYQNTATGTYALQYNTTGYQNTALGAHALQQNTTGLNNTANGFRSLFSNTTGGSNTALGHNSGRTNTTGSNNTFIGTNAGYTGTTNGLTNATAIGYNTQVTASNSLILGNGANVGIGTTAPDTLLHVEGLGAGITLTRTGGFEAFLKLTTASAVSQIRALSGGGMRFTYNDIANEAFRYDASGNIGIGTTAPAYKLDVSGGTGVVGQFSGRVIGANAVNSNEFITKFQLDGVTGGTGSTGAFVQGGNSFGTTATIGTNDNYGLNFETNNVTVASLSNTGAALFKNSTNSTTAFQIQNAAGTSNLFVADTTNNKVGIGMTPGTNTLSVSGAIDVVGSTGLGTLTAGSNSLDFSRAGSNYIRATGSFGDLTFRTGANNIINVLKLDSSGKAYFQNSTNSTNAFQIQDSAGTSLFTADTTNSKVGIGMAPSSTGAQLQVGGNINAGSSTAATGLLVGDTGYGVFGFYGVVNSAVASTADNYALIQGPDGTTLLNSAAGQNLGLLVGNVRHLTVTSAGDVGIGTATPTAKLSVYKASNASLSVLSGGGAGNTASIEFGPWAGRPGGAANRFVSIDDGNFSANYTIWTAPPGSTGNPVAVERFRITSSGNVGIGTTTPGSLLQVGTNTTTASGGLQFGTDTNLYRNGANVLRTGNQFYSDNNIFANLGMSSQISLRNIAGLATIRFGSAEDTNLYRFGPDTLKTDDSFIADGGLTVGTLGTQGSIRLARPSDGNLTGTIAYSSVTADKEIRFTEASGGGYFTWYTNNGGTAERMRLSNSGQLQLATQGSTGGILLGGDSNLYRSTTSTLKTDGALFAAGNFTNTGAALFKNATNSTTALQVQNAAGTNLFTVDTTNGVVGINTAAPESAGNVKLHVAGGDILLDNNANIYFYDSVGTRQQVLTYSTANNLGLRNAASSGSIQIRNDNDLGAIQFYTGSAVTERARINATGEFGIGVSPTSGAGLLQLAAGTTIASGIGFGTDTNLYRSAANELTTDDSLIIAGNTTGYNTAAATLKVGKDSVTGRSINAAGTINAAGADFAEWIAWSGPKPAVGSVIQKHGQLYVVSSTATAAFVGNDKISGSDSILVGFSGQVPVRVSAEGGAIAAGDYLTLGTDGRAKKATGPAQVVGRAQGSLASGTGTIQVTLQYMYYNPTAGDFIQNGGGASLSSLAVSGSASLGGLNVSGPTALSSLLITGDAEVQGALKVATLEVGNIKVNGHIVTAGDAPLAEVMAASGTDAVYTIDGNDTAGTITITTGTGSVAAGELMKVTFKNPFGKAPRVILSAQDSGSINSRIFPSSKTATDYMLKTSQILPSGQTYTFDYFIVE